MKEGQCSGRKGPGKGRSPAGRTCSPLRAEGRWLLQRLRLPLDPWRPLELVGTASWPDGRNTGVVLSGPRVRRLTSLGAWWRVANNGWGGDDKGEAANSSHYIYNIYTEQNYKRNTFGFVPIFHELNSKIHTYTILKNWINKLYICLCIWQT